MSGARPPFEQAVRAICADAVIAMTLRTHAHAHTLVRLPLHACICSLDVWMSEFPT